MVLRIATSADYQPDDMFENRRDRDVSGFRDDMSATGRAQTGRSRSLDGHRLRNGRMPPRGHCLEGSKSTAHVEKRRVFRLALVRCTTMERQGGFTLNPVVKSMWCLNCELRAAQHSTCQAAATRSMVTSWQEDDRERERKGAMTRGG